MTDILLLGATAGFFLLCLAYTRVCDRL